MFNSTHTLVGAAIARTGVDRWLPGALWTAVIAANLPDIDIVTELGSTASYLDHHRGITHSLAGVPTLSLLLALVMWRFFHGSFWKHFAVAMIAMATHPLLDFMNNYGLRPFLPLNGTWYYGDSLFIIDPYLDLLLAGGLYLGYRKPSLRAAAAILVLSVAVLYMAGRLELSHIAQRELQKHEAEIAGMVQSTVSPQMLNPLAWTGFVETKDDITAFSLNLIDGSLHETTRMVKAPPSAVSQAAAASYVGRVFLGSSRLLVTRIETTAAGYRVLLIDFRFFRQAANSALAAEILLDRSLQVTAQSISFTQSIQ